MERCDERLQRFSALSETLEEHRGDTQQSVLKMEVPWLFFHPTPGWNFVYKIVLQIQFWMSKGFDFLGGYDLFIPIASVYGIYIHIYIYSFTIKKLTIHVGKSTSHMDDTVDA